MKKTVFLAVALVLALSMALTGTIAYLSDTDSAVNVMTLGNVKIEQHEMKRADGVAYNKQMAEKGDLVEFKQGVQLYPAYPTDSTVYTAGMTSDTGFHWGPYVHTGTAWNGLWDETKLVGAVDKMVFVENTGKSPAYFRTIIAFEYPEGVEIGEPSQGAHIMINANGGNLYGALADRYVGEITVSGVRYAMFEYVYTDALLPGEWSHPSLLQVVMTHHATNKEMELLGDTYEILVYTQAVQTANFESVGADAALDAAFGDITVDNNPWVSEGQSSMNIVYAGTQEDLNEDLKGDTVILSAGTYTFPSSDKFNADTTIVCAEGTVFEGISGLNLNGGTVVGATFSNPGDAAVKGTINGTIKDCTFTGTSALRWCYAGETVVFENCVFDGTSRGVHFDQVDNEIIFKNCTFSGFNAFGSGTGKLILEGCSFVATGNSTYNGVNLYGDTDFIDCTFVFDHVAASEWIDLEGDNATVTFTNCVVTDGTTETPLADVVGNYGEGNTIIIDGVTL